MIIDRATTSQQIRDQLDTMQPGETIELPRSIHTLTRSAITPTRELIDAMNVKRGRQWTYKPKGMTQVVTRGEL